jgi:hypothetical protein
MIWIERLWGDRSRGVVDFSPFYTEITADHPFLSFDDFAALVE